jgi:hypothetical protein
VEGSQTGAVAPTLKESSVNSTQSWGKGNRRPPLPSGYCTGAGDSTLTGKHLRKTANRHACPGVGCSPLAAAAQRKKLVWVSLLARQKIDAIVSAASPLASEYFHGGPRGLGRTTSPEAREILPGNTSLSGVTRLVRSFSMKRQLRFDSRSGDSPARCNFPSSRSEPLW